MRMTFWYLVMLGLANEGTLAQDGLRLTVTSPLEYPNTPLDPTIDFGAFVEELGLDGTFDPNSIVVRDLVSGETVPHLLTEDFAYSDRGRIEFVIADPTHIDFEIRFQTNKEGQLLQPQSYVPPIGVGDLLRYNAGVPRPITMFYSMGLHDLNRDGIADLVGTWNYAYRPGSPWDGVIAYSGIDHDRRFEFDDLLRLRRQDDGLSFFSHTYMAAAFADLNLDDRIDLVMTRRGTGTAEFFLNTNEADHSRMPTFRSSGSVAVNGWEACRIVDLNHDGAVDLVVDGEFVRNTNPEGWPFQATETVKLDAGRSPCFLDVDADGLLDSVCLHGGETVQPDFHQVAWRKNLGGDSPRFGNELLIDEIDVPYCTAVSTYHIHDESGVIVQHNAFQEISFYRLVLAEGGPRFEKQGRAESLSAVMSFSDQAWPCLCDWDDDGDLDMLVGGGYGWPRIVINEGTRSKPSFAEPKMILAEGQPVRLLRNELLGEPLSFHDMGYTYPEFVDWDADGLKDLILPNETNRIYWYKNIGTKKEPRFGARRQILCDDYPESDELRTQSATRAADPQSNNGVYPYEAERPFFWRTGAAIADFNGDELPDLVTHHGQNRVATLFTQSRAEDGSLVLHEAGPLKLEEGTPINDAIVQRAAHWTESFRANDWDQDGLVDLIYSIAGAHHGTLEGGSIYLLRNVGTATDPQFAPPQAMKCFGEPIQITNHGPHPYSCDFDNDGRPDLVACVEWSVYPYYSHAALMMPQRPEYKVQLLPRSESGQ
ncbi:MAG: VCBS repeat-containing protein [Planctomycetaceae bacterium]